MFEIGETVSYGTTGVCVIDSEIEKNVKGVNRKYLVLKPVFQNNATVYVPEDNETLLSRIRKVLTAGEVEELISQIPGYNTKWIANDNERIKLFRQILVSGDREQLTKMVRMLYLHRKNLYSKGRKLHSTDEHFLKDAQTVLFGEFAVALGIRPEEVESYIDRKIAG